MKPNLFRWPKDSALLRSLEVLIRIFVLAFLFAAVGHTEPYRLEFSTINQSAGASEGGHYQLTEASSVAPKPGHFIPARYSQVSILMIDKPLALLSPNDGGQYLWAQNVDVQWRILSDFAGELVNIELWQEGRFVSFLDVAADSAVQQTLSINLGFPPAGAGYKIRVVSILNRKIYDESDEPFTVAADSNLINAVPVENWSLYP